MQSEAFYRFYRLRLTANFASVVKNWKFHLVISTEEWKLPSGILCRDNFHLAADSRGDAISKFLEKK